MIGMGDVVIEDERFGVAGRAAAAVVNTTQSERS